MSRFYDFHLYLFDFDGLLVNTELLHFEAYTKMLQEAGLPFDWDFGKYCIYSHQSTEAFKKQLEKEFPQYQPTLWEEMYQRKRQIYLSLLRKDEITLLPGVESFLEELDQKKIKRAVVTNSPLEQIETIKGFLPALQAIDHWFTRETYKNPKPDPECYLTAMKALAEDGDKVVGFEDTPRGVKALQGAGVYPILVSESPHKSLQVEKYPSFHELSKAWNQSQKV